MINIHRYLTEEQAQKCVADSDALFDSELLSIYDELLVSRGRFHGQAVKAIALCGPTCAGKTTTAKKLTSLLFLEFCQFLSIQSIQEPHAIQKSPADSWFLVQNDPA